MPQQIICPHCAKRLTSATDVGGKRVNCPGCKTPFVVPAAAQSSASERVASAAAPAGAPATSARPEAPQRAPAPAAAKLIDTPCPKCAKPLKAPLEYAGRNVRCPECKAAFTIPGPPVERRGSSLASTAAPNVPPTRAKQTLAAVAAKQPAPATPAPSKPAAFPRSGALPRRSGSRPRFLYCVFALALAPLGIQTFAPESDFMQRIERTTAAHPELMDELEAAEDDAQFFALLPENRFEGAHLPRETWVHWIYAAVAAAFFIGLVRLLFESGDSTIPHLILVGVVTATVGIISLLAFQWIADWSQGVWVRGRGVVVVLFYIVKFIGFSYNAASDPSNGFLLSFLGFTLGVGLCEEITKAFPIFAWLGSDRKIDWRGACALGLASGVGFGVAEGIMYSANYYNGVMTGDIYVTRFVSCVALHAIWTASVAVHAAHNQAALETSEGSDYLVSVLFVIGIPAILHGLYDTLLKKDMSGLALAVAAASFMWLILMIERARSADDVPSRRMTMATA